jgi:hypothetical protein
MRGMALARKSLELDPVECSSNSIDAVCFVNFGSAGGSVTDCG